MPLPAVPETVGFLATVSLLAGLPLVPFWGAWADRYSRKIIIVRSAVVEAVLFVLLAFVTDVRQLFLLVPLVGLVLGNTGVMLAEITDRAPRVRLGLAISIVGAAGPLGLAVGPLIGGPIVDQYGLQTLFLIDAAITGVIVIALVLGYHEAAGPDPQRAAGDDARAPIAGGGAAHPPGAGRVRDLLLRAPGPATGDALPGALRRGHQWAGAAGVDRGAGGRVHTALRRPSARRSRVPSPTGSASGECCWARSRWPRWLRSRRPPSRSLLPFAIDYAILGVGFATAGSMLFATLATGLPADIRSAVLNLALVPAYLSGIVGSLLAVQVVQRSDGDLRPLWILAGDASSASRSCRRGDWRRSFADGLRCRHE